MNCELEVLEIVTSRLEAMGIRYMVSGSIAMNYYAEPRMTRDIDLVVEIGAEHAEGLVQAFANDFYIDIHSVRTAIRRERMFNLIHFDKVVKVDMIVRKESPYRRTEFQRRRKVSYEDLNLWIVSPEDLLLSKLVWAKAGQSELQKRDARNILRSAPDLDQDYLAQWAGRLSVAALLEEARR